MHELIMLQSQKSTLKFNNLDLSKIKINVSFFDKNGKIKSTKILNFKPFIKNSK